MDASASNRRSIVEWDENEVQNWLSGLGFPQYEYQLKEHNISGEVLCMMDVEGLKGVGVSTIGQRLSILKSVYLTKLAHNIPIEPGDYVPPSEAEEHPENLTVDKLYGMLKILEKQVHDQQEEIRALRDLYENRSFHNGSIEDSPIQRQDSFKWATYVKPARSPTKPDIIESPHPSPQQAEHNIYDKNSFPSTSTSHQRLRKNDFVESPQPSPQQAEYDLGDRKGTSHPPQRSRAQNSVSDPSTSNDLQHSASSSSIAAPKPQRQESSDNLKSFKVTLDDPTWKVLPAALKKYKINNDSWQNYAMFICYGSTGNRIERCLSYDEKPLLLFQKLKDAKKNPVFMLKHIKDIRSPIAVAQQKHAARKASSASSAAASAALAPVTTLEPPSSEKSHTRPAPRPPKLEVSDLSAGGSSYTSIASPQPGWPEVVLSPAVDNKEREEVLSGGGGVGGVVMPSVNLIGPPSADSGRSRGGGDNMGDVTSVGHARETITSSGVSYAVAIYPYMAEQEDEFDVVVGDTFVILSRARGWWVVQRDPTGSGAIDTDTSKQGWVPAGCLLETNVPVASAIAEAHASTASTGAGANRTPILPLSIISTSFPGIALMDYKKKGEEELDLVKDDALRVFKRYNHWSYAVKEEGGDRGWVPSWFIGKVQSAGAVTPNTGNVNITAPSTAVSGSGSALGSEQTDGGLQNQISPMSSAFPPVQQPQMAMRTTTVI